MFDQIAPTYDRANRFLSFGLDLHWRRSLAKHVPKIKSLDLLDIATGTGDQIAVLIHKKTSIQSAIGIDLSEKMLSIARNKCFHPSVRFQKADAEALPFDDQSFDLCTLSFGIRNFERPLTALSEMLRVTKAKGRCLILEFSLPRNRMRLLFQFYLRHPLTYIGGWFAKDRSPYRHLNQTIENFASREEFMGWMDLTGWKNVVSFNLFLGLVTLYRGDKE